MSRRQLQCGEPPPRLTGDDTGCPILHVDMDAFYASVELRSRPDLAGTPVIVGGLGSRSVVLSATYEARAFGVHSAMPMMRARRLCPQATVIPPTPGAYAEASRGVMEIFRSVTPLVEPLALDEAFLDVGGARRRLGGARAIGELIRARVVDEQGITCSVGVAATKFVAKLASARAKPDGLLVVPRDATVEFLHPLPVGALWGVGERTEEALTRLGLRTIGDIAHTPATTLRRALGPAAGAHLSASAGSSSTARAGATTPSGWSGPGSGWWACGSRGSPPRVPRLDSWRSAAPARSGGLQSALPTARRRGSAPARCSRPRWSARPNTTRMGNPNQRIDCLLPQLVLRSYSHQYAALIRVRRRLEELCRSPSTSKDCSSRSSSPSMPRTRSSRGPGGPRTSTR